MILLLSHSAKVRPALDSILRLLLRLFDPRSLRNLPAPILPTSVRLLLRPLHRTLHRSWRISRLRLRPGNLRALKTRHLPLHLLRSGSRHLHLSLRSRIEDLMLRLSPSSASSGRRTAAPIVPSSLTQHSCDSSRQNDDQKRQNGLNTMSVSPSHKVPLLSCFTHKLSKNHSTRIHRVLTKN